MKPEYIIVQAGGKGTRLGRLTENKPKALVPVRNLPILFHLFRKFPEAKYIIIADYKKEVLRHYLASFAEVEYLVVDAGEHKGTCAGIAAAAEKLPADEEFMLIWSDLILSENFTFPEEEGEYIGLSDGFTCRWSYQNGIFKETPSDHAGVAGLFIFSDKSSLNGVPAEGEFVKWLRQERRIFHSLKLTGTKEFGLISAMEKANDESRAFQCRPFNQIRVNPSGRIVKEGIDSQGRDLAALERDWYRFVTERGFPYIPKIYGFDPLEMEYVKGKNIFQYRLSHEEKKHVLSKIIKCLRELHGLGETPSDYFSIYDAYVQKTWKRIDRVRDLIPFADRREILINGKSCRNIFFRKDEIEEMFSQYTCDRFVFLHGDNTFSNIMLDQNMEPVLIDPRGYFGHTKYYGDPLYDWAKLYYSIVGNYDQFNRKNFTLTIGEQCVILKIASNGWEDMENEFFRMLDGEADKRLIRLLHAVIWLSLSTYAWEDFDSICGAFYNGLYCLESALEGKDEGIFEEFIKILEKAVHSIDLDVFEQLIQACERVLDDGGKIIASGLGKNVPVCEKFVGTMISLGLDANFMHTNSAVHGDLGMVRRKDLVILLSKSGTTAETVYLFRFLKEKGCKVWLLTFNPCCPLAGEVDGYIAVRLEHEGDQWNIVPNNSTILNLIVLQTLAMELAKRRNITLEDFKPNHPGGAIGTKLREGQPE